MYQRLKGNVNGSRASLALAAVIVFIDGDKTYAEKRKYLIDIIAYVNEIPAEPGKILNNDTAYFLFLRKLQ